MPAAFPNESADYRAARDELLAQEIALRRHMEAVSAARRALPPGPEVLQDYVFDGVDGEVRLSELFGEADSLVLYHFMFPRYSTDSRAKPASGATAALPITESPCPSCTALLDQLDSADLHFRGLGGNMAVVAKTSIHRLAAFASDRGWRNLRLLSAAGNSFKRDYRSEDENGEQMPLLTVFHREPDGTMRLFWASELLYAPTDPGQDPRHVGTVEPLWNLFDFTPAGRPAADEQIQYSCCCG